MAIAKFPHRYTVSLQDRRLLAPPRAPIAAGPPPQFGGTDDAWSPEEMLVGAVLECLWTTFEAYARRDHLEVLGWRGAATGVLDRGPAGPVFTMIAVAVTLELHPGDDARARAILASAERDCIISRALKVPVTLAVTTTDQGYGESIRMSVVSSTPSRT